MGRIRVMPSTAEAPSLGPGAGPRAGRLTSGVREAAGEPLSERQAGRRVRPFLAFRGPWTPPGPLSVATIIPSLPNAPAGSRVSTVRTARRYRPVRPTWPPTDWEPAVTFAPPWGQCVERSQTLSIEDRTMPDGTTLSNLIDTFNSHFAGVAKLERNGHQLTLTIADKQMVFALPGIVGIQATGSLSQESPRRHTQTQ